MRKYKSNLVINILLIILIIILLIVNNISFLVIDFTSNKLINFILFLVVCISQTVALVLSIIYSLVPSIKAVRNKKEFDRVGNDSKHDVPTAIHQMDLCKVLEEILDSRKEDIVKLFNSEEVTDIEFSTDDEELEEQSQMFVENHMISLSSWKTYPKLVVYYGTKEIKHKFSIVLDNSIKSNIVGSGVHRVPTRVFIYLYQVICDLNRTDIELTELLGGEILVKCRSELSVFNDYKEILTKGVINVNEKSKVIF